MSPPVPAYRRGPAGPRETWLAALAGASVGLVVFYLARTWLRREPVGPRPSRGAEGAGPTGRPFAAPPGRRPNGDGRAAERRPRPGPAGAEAAGD